MEWIFDELIGNAAAKAAHQERVDEAEDCASGANRQAQIVNKAAAAVGANGEQGEGTGHRGT